MGFPFKAGGKVRKSLPVNDGVAQAFDVLANVSTQISGQVVAIEMV